MSLLVVSLCPRDPEQRVKSKIGNDGLQKAQKFCLLGFLESLQKDGLERLLRTEVKILKSNATSTEYSEKDLEHLH